MPNAFSFFLLRGSFLTTSMEFICPNSSVCTCTLQFCCLHDLILHVNLFHICTKLLSFIIIYRRQNFILTTKVFSLISGMGTTTTYVFTITMLCGFISFPPLFAYSNINEQYAYFHLSLTVPYSFWLRNQCRYSPFHRRNYLFHFVQRNNHGLLSNKKSLLFINHW